MELFPLGLKNSACKSGLAVKSGVVKSENNNIVKVYKNLGPKYSVCYIRNFVKSGADKAVVHCNLSMIVVNLRGKNRGFWKTDFILN